ncbi:hypothetical protein FRC02_002869, partial [Tulasnella sp. 418]
RHLRIREMIEEEDIDHDGLAELEVEMKVKQTTRRHQEDPNGSDVPMKPSREPRLVASNKHNEQVSSPPIHQLPTDLIFFT